MTATVHKRFLSSIFGNALKSAIAFLSGIFLARALGPDDFGRMVFLGGIFLAFKQLFDPGISTAFFTFNARRLRGKKFITTYFCWIAIQLIISISLIAFLLPESIIYLIWRDNSRELIILALIATYIQTVFWSTLVQLSESQKQTYLIQKVGLITSVVNITLLFGAYYLKYLDLKFVFIIIIIEWTFASVFTLSRIKFRVSKYGNIESLIFFKNYKNKYLLFVPYTIISIFYDFIERWLLQKYGGNTQQAFYGIAFQIASISAVATSACVNIYWKEIADAKILKNFKYVQDLYTKTTKNLMLLTISISAFIYPWLNEIISILLGNDYVEGAEVLGIMLFFPLLQSLSQMGTTTFYAYEKIKIQSLVGILYMFISIIITYIFTAPQSAYIPGFNLGAWGFALKTVLIQVLVVSTSLYLLSKKLKILFEYKSLLSIGVFCIAFGFLSKLIALNIFLTNSTYINLFLSGLIFSILLFVSISFFPKVFGFYKRDLFFYKI